MNLTPEELDEFERILAARAEHNSVTIAELDRVVALASKLVAELRRLQALAPATPIPTLRPEDAIVSLDLTGRSKCLLIRAGITQIRDLTARTAGDLLMLRGFGPACLREVKEALDAHGLRLAGGAS